MWRRQGWNLELGPRNFPGFWSLVFGVCCFILAPNPQKISLYAGACRSRKKDMSKSTFRRSSGSLTRRQFIYYSALAAGTTVLGSYTARAKFKSPNEKLAVGIIGCGGKGQADSQGLSGENIVALCDVDAKTLASAAKKWPN